MPRATGKARRPLTSDIACKSAKAENVPYKRSAGGGLYLLVNPDGSKYWRVAYRWHGAQRTLALGTYPSVGLSEARSTSFRCLGRPSKCCANCAPYPETACSFSHRPARMG